MTGGNTEVDTLEDYDYEYLGFCQIEGTRQGYNGQFVDCREPAIARIWWDNYDEGLLVCPEHFTKLTGTQTQ